MEQVAQARPVPRPARRLPPRRLFGLFVLALAGAGGWWWWSTAQAVATNDWNVLLITFDTTRADRLGCYGYKHTETPAIDMMAAHGIRYENCFAPAPLTLPAHASMMTGYYPFHHGLRNNGVGPLDPRFATLAQVLRDHGYATGAVVGAYVLERRFGLDRGFDHYDCDFTPTSQTSKFEYAERRASAVTDAGIAWLNQLGDKRFFLWVHYFDPHAPYAAPGYDPAQATHSAYDREIMYADRELDRLLNVCAQIKQSTQRPTLLVFTGDHGESLWEHGEPTHGLFLYNATVHVPLIVFLPSREGSGAVMQTPVSTVDVFPSILSWLGIAPPHKVHGQVLPTRPEQDTPPENSRRALLIDGYGGFSDYGWSPLEAIVQGNSKFIAAPRPELFDLAADPQELTNLWSAAEPRVTAAESALAQIKALSLDTAPAVAGISIKDAETLQKLRALGYVGGSESDEPAGHDALADPKDRIEAHRNVIEAQAKIDAADFRGAFDLVAGVLRQEHTNKRALLIMLDVLSSSDTRSDAIRFATEQLGSPLPHPYDSLIPLFIGIGMASDGQLAAAEEQFRKAVAADPQNADANFNLGQAALTLRGDLEAAIPLLETAQSLSPRNRTYVLGLGTALERSGALERALQMYQAALDIDPQDAVALNNAAWARLLLRRDQELALRDARRAVEIRPDAAALRQTLGAVLNWAGQCDEAITQLSKAMELDPRYASASYQLGLAFEAKGDSASAAKAFRAALELAGDPAPTWRDDARERLSKLQPQ